eukprot:gene12260-25769_t
MFYNFSLAILLNYIVFLVVDGTGGTTVVESNDQELTYSVDFGLNYKDFIFSDRFVFTKSDLTSRLKLLRKAVEFCDRVLTNLPFPWTVFYLDPSVCSNNLYSHTVHHENKFILSEISEHSNSDISRQLFQTSMWCKSKDNWLWSLDKYEQSTSSQDVQDGLLDRIFSLDGIGHTNKYYVEIGFNSVTFEGGSGSNTLNLNRNGWSGLLLDIHNENTTINLRKHFISAKNIVQIFNMYQVPAEPDYVSIDIDSQDLWVLRSIISSGIYRPRVLTVEFNPNFPLSSTITIPPDVTHISYNDDILFGAAAGAIKAVAEEFGYTVVYMVLNLDLILIRTDLLQGHCPPPFFMNYYHKYRVHKCIRQAERMFQWIDYISWRDTGGDIETARVKAVEQIILSANERSPSKSIHDNELKCLGIDTTMLALYDTNSNTNSLSMEEISNSPIMSNIDMNGQSSDEKSQISDFLHI